MTLWTICHFRNSFYES